MGYTQVIVVPCDHRLKSGDKCPGHMIEVRVKDGVVTSTALEGRKVGG